MKIRLTLKCLPLLFLLSLITAKLPAVYAQGQMPANTGQDSKQGTSKEKPSPDSAFVCYFYQNPQGSYTLKKISSSLYKLQDYDAVQQGESMYASLGNPGSASSPLSYRFCTVPSFDLWLRNFAPYRFSFDSTRFYISDSPYSRLDYVMGSSKEQRLVVTHSQQVRKGLTLSLNARFANAPGIYLRQRSFYSGVTLNASYFTPSKRYGVVGTYLNDRFRVYENGGLAYDSVFTNNTDSKRQTFLVNLDEAMNRGKSSGFLLQQYFNLQKSQAKEADSLGQPVKTRRFDAGRFVYTFRYSRNSAVYEDLDPDVQYYPAIFLDSLTTYDTAAQIHFENSLVYSNIEPDTSGKEFPLQYAFGIKHLNDRIVNDSLTSTFTHLVPFGTLRGIIAGKTFFTASGKIYLGDYNNGDYDLSGEFYQYIGRKNEYRLWLSASNGLIHPDYFYQRYLSNHYKWDNDFKAESYQIGTAGIDIKGFRLIATATRVSNFVYLDKTAQPRQLDDGLMFVSFNFSKDLKIGHWIFGSNATWQQTTKDTILSLPAITARLTVCYNMDLFKKALKAQIGFDVRYNTLYYANAYNPVLRSFYLQDEKKYGDYPYGDVFLNFKVKRARIFIKYQHANAGLLGYTYMMVPGYPQADASLKFGICWVFFD